MEEDPIVAHCRQRVGQLISGKWRLDALIGVGGMAAVYMATFSDWKLLAGGVSPFHDGWTGGLRISRRTVGAAVLFMAYPAYRNKNR